MGPLCPCPNSKEPMKKKIFHGFSKTLPQFQANIRHFALQSKNWSERDDRDQGQTDNSWGPQAIGDHGAPVSLPKLKKAYEKGTRGISWGPLLTPGPRTIARVSKWSIRP
ncbi:unnamed protein product [Staurois parvus]|uniref:Uncharacterized protein n=1 Tax=Staurois parvus TaxID=386267 RepID=A0ABN9FPV8_9NEOB|nr:unnamed protein product [Staurois parvus]